MFDSILGVPVRIAHRIEDEEGPGVAFRHDRHDFPGAAARRRWRPKACRGPDLMHIRQEESERHVLSLTVDNEAGILRADRRPVLRARLQYREPDRGRHQRGSPHQPHHHRDQRPATRDRPDHRRSSTGWCRSPGRRPAPTSDRSSSASWRWSRSRRGRHAQRSAAPCRRVPRQVVDTTIESFIFEITGPTSKIDKLRRPDAPARPR